MKSISLNSVSLARKIYITHLFAILFGSTFSLNINAQISAQTPIQEAATLGTGKGIELFNNVTSRQPDSSAVPGFTGTNQPQQNLFQGGKGELVGPGINRAGGCSQANDSECQAVNLLQWGPNNRPVPTFSANDPLLVGARQKMDNAKSLLGTFGTAAGTTAGLLTQTVMQCEAKTVVTPATYETSVCDETAQLENKTCTVDQVVKVDAQYDYLCEKTLARKTTQTCNKTLAVACSGATPLQSCRDGSAPINGRCHAQTETQEAATISGYTCPTGFTSAGSNCVKTETTAASIASYSCPAGSTPSGSSCLTIQSISPNANNTCPAGYTLNGASCQRTVTSSATPVYACPTGFTNSGSTCTRQLSQPGTPIYSCPAGTQPTSAGASTCRQQITTSATPTGVLPGTTQADITTTYGANASGYYMTMGSIGDNYWGQGVYDRTMRFDIQNKDSVTVFNLTRAIFDDWLLVKINNTTIAVGPYGGDRLEYGWFCQPDGEGGSSCLDVRYGEHLYGWSEMRRSWDFQLNVDLRPYLVNGQNTIFTRTIVGGRGEMFIQFNTQTFGCPQNTQLIGNTCVSYTTVPANVSLTCPAGFTSAGSNCVRTETSAASIASYSCPAGSTPSGSSCLTIQSISPNVNNTCPAGYTLNGASCQRTVTSSATPVYVCPTGFTNSGSTCTKQLTQAGTPQYTCRQGGTVIGNMCRYLLTTDTNPDVSYTCPVSGELTATSAVNGITTYSCCVDTFQNACQGLEARVQ